MSSVLQTLAALLIVALAAAFLTRSLLKKRRQPGCSSEGCGAVSPGIKKLPPNRREKRDRV
jgi:hypothetical protein